MGGTLTVGIACDNYKLEMFKEKLDEDEFQYEVKDGITEDSKIIKVTYENTNQLNDIKTICQTVEFHFKNRN